MFRLNYISILRGTNLTESTRPLVIQSSRLYLMLGISCIHPYQKPTTMIPRASRNAIIRPMTTPVTPDFGSDSEGSSSSSVKRGDEEEQRAKGKRRGICRRLTFPFTPPHLMYSKKSRRLDYSKTSLSPSLFFPEIPSPDNLIEDTEQARENNTAFRLNQRMNRIFIPRLEKQEDYEFQSANSLRPKPVTIMRVS